MNYLDVANSGWMWIACIPAVLWVLFQSFLFLMRSLKDGKEMGLDSTVFKRAARSTFAASVGPCFVMFSGMVALMVNIGAPLAWLRLDFIGSSVYELMAANYSAEAMGVQLGSSGMNVDVLLNAAIIMPLGCLGWVIFSGLFSDKMHIVNDKLSGGNEVLVPILGAAGIMGAWSSLTLDKVIPFGPSAVAAIFAGITMAIIIILNKKWDKQWLREWSVSIAMVIGMLGAVYL